MVIVVGCEQQLQTICGLQLSSCNFVSRRKRRRRRSGDSSAGVAMPLLFMPCRISAIIACKLQVVSSVCNRSCSSILSVGSRRWRTRLVCMGAEKSSHRQQQQHSQQQRRELSPVEQEEEEDEVMEEDLMTQGDEFPSSSGAMEFSLSAASVVDSDATAMADRRRKERKRERTAYMFAAIASSIGFVTLAAGAVYYRFIWQMQGNGEVPYSEMLGTFSLAVGAAVGMEFWARWAHRALWHASLWNMHESHHRPREGPFELNDIFAIINAVPAISLTAIGFFNHGFVPGLCFGGGLGITMFGMAYMFVHDGLVHRRFPVGPVADVPYLQKVAAAHQLHHADLFGGVPYGLFLGPEELEEVGGQDELQKVLNLRYKVREGDRD